MSEAQIKGGASDEELKHDETIFTCFHRFGVSTAIKDNLKRKNLDWLSW